jgi:hypothetical protein
MCSQAAARGLCVQRPGALSEVSVVRETRRSSARQRHGWIGVAPVVAVVAIALGALAAIYAERLTVGEASSRCAIPNWIADAACLVCVIKVVGEPVPWAAILIIWMADIGAASPSPVPTGLGVVDIALITALAIAGLLGRYSVATVLVYPFISLKVPITVVCLAYHYAAGRRRAYAAESAPNVTWIHCHYAMRAPSRADLTRHQGSYRMAGECREWQTTREYGCEHRNPRSDRAWRHV